MEPLNKGGIPRRSLPQRGWALRSIPGRILDAVRRGITKAREYLPPLRRKWDWKREHDEFVEVLQILTGLGAFK